jgi:hypothetical protein
MTSQVAAVGAMAAAHTAPPRRLLHPVGLEYAIRAVIQRPPVLTRQHARGRHHLPDPGKQPVRVR